MFCSNCGSVIEPDENFCRECGQKAVRRSDVTGKGPPTLVLPDTHDTRQQYGSAGPITSPVTQVSAAENRKSARGIVIALISVGLLLLIAAPLAAYFLFWRTDDAGSQGVALRLQGSNTIGASMAPALVEAFLKKRGATDVKRLASKDAKEITIQALMPGEKSPRSIEIKAPGSDHAFTGLAKGECDIGLASRKIKAEEVQQLSSLGDMTSRASEHVLALDGLAVIVNSENSVAKLTKEEIGKIFTGEIKDWSEVSEMRGKINVYARDDHSGTFDTFKSLVLGKDKKLVSDAKRYEDSNELSRNVSQDKNGIGFIGLPFIGNAKAVAVSESGSTPLKPSRFTVATEDYLLTRRLYLYTAPNPSNPLASEFVKFALSEDGQKIVENEKFVSLSIKGEKPTTTSREAPIEYQEITRGAERLSLNFRFRAGKKELDNKALRDIDLVVEILGKGKNAGQKILLLGFTDNTGNAEKNVQLSKERAGTVAEEFKQRGIAPAVVTGFGAEMPVASNDNKEGQEKNRRVEIWLKP
jgi:phosphate transport system substrate-binding protein